MIKDSTENISPMRFLGAMGKYLLIGKSAITPPPLPPLQIPGRSPREDLKNILSFHECGAGEKAIHHSSASISSKSRNPTKR